ncbi:DNA-methyltransferase [Actinomadura decatromicini]|uniref:Methyltransferase n=1 Tax=Actinomadura decatromicini TaxID=2604572 RepID=A0A5D3F6C8_9ACTN|nr:site-specific DNA-methyltransferase [Actinomadura decatromicini]TYK44577.1 site-specific DNA-methyltransferase [Actinomadura decatromicini]
MKRLPRNTILVGDVRERLRDLPEASVDTVITSPPYFGLRDYGVDEQLGLEPHVDAWTANLQRVFADVARVIKPTGSVWLNLGDSFSRHPRHGAPPKGLLLAPERLLLALTEDGWIVRNKVIWAKSNPMPSSVTDRLSLTYEVVYFLVRSKEYFFDLDAIREPHRSSAAKRSRSPRNIGGGWAGPLAAPREGLRRSGIVRPGHPLGKNPGDVWQIATRGTASAHFAVFPEELVRRPLLATCPEKVCSACGRPWRRRVLRSRDLPTELEGVITLPELRPDCRCGAPTVPGVVLDPFFGTGTTGAVAARYGRDWVGIELNPDYAEMARARLGLTPPETAA